MALIQIDDHQTNCSGHNELNIADLNKIKKMSKNSMLSSPQCTRMYRTVSRVVNVLRYIYINASLFSRDWHAKQKLNKIGCGNSDLTTCGTFACGFFCCLLLYFTRKKGHLARILSILKYYFSSTTSLWTLPRFTFAYYFCVSVSV